ncbi:hypothetical protein KIN24_22045 (plasmid) [Pseudomonas lundensis]|nr:hypothetical protein [Pseudomonas lundensis]QVQ79697.1 hypothetical protein KIN24_22045 [Pseudomonas lundensis]
MLDEAAKVVTRDVDKKRLAPLLYELAKMPQAPGAAAMNQTDEFVIDGSEPTKPGRGVRRVNYTPLAVLAGVTVATVAALLGYRVGKKRGKGD